METLHCCRSGLQRFAEWMMYVVWCGVVWSSGRNIEEGDLIWGAAIKSPQLSAAAIHIQKRRNYCSGNGHFENSV